MIPTSVLQWKSTAEKYAAIHPVLKPNEILAIIWSESSGNPKAINPADPSYGLMQVTIAIGRKFSMRVTTPADLMDPDTNHRSRQRIPRTPKNGLRRELPSHRSELRVGGGLQRRGTESLAEEARPELHCSFRRHLAELNSGGNA